MRAFCKIGLAAATLIALACPLRGRAQAALLMEEPYGLFGTINPTGHNAIYLARVCAETPVKLRRCSAGETGTVISRYQGMDGYDWVAMPLIPYLYSVEKTSDVPESVDRFSVVTMRNRYHEAHLLTLGPDIDRGNIVHGGWTQLVGAAYERRIYAFRFETTETQDDALIEKLNADDNRSHFELLYNNCADFARVVLNTYFPRTFKRTIFPDAGITTPKQIAYKLVRYGRKHPQIHLTVMEIPMVPGYQHLRRSNNSVAEALITSGYAIPIAIVNPWLAGGILLDYLVEGRFRSLPRHPMTLEPGNLLALTGPAAEPQNRLSAGTQADGASATGTPLDQTVPAANPGLAESTTPHE